MPGLEQKKVIHFMSCQIEIRKISSKNIQFKVKVTLFQKKDYQ